MEIWREKLVFGFFFALSWGYQIVPAKKDSEMWKSAAPLEEEEVLLQFPITILCPAAIGAEK